MFRVVGVAALLAALAGCTATRLSLKTNNQADTLSDIDRQQVLDNLALFAYDLEALPFFAYASQGTASLSNQSGLSVTNLLTSQTQESWQLTPINDPRKLERMRCVYQRVISLHRRQAMRGDCPNCARVLSDFYTGDPDLRIDQRDQGGAVTVDCLDGRKWLAIGCKSCAPTIKRCAVGKYCDVRVWVLPGGSGELSKLTLTVLDYALHDPPAKSNKNVTFHLDQHGELTTAGNSYADVSGQVSADGASDTLVTMPYVTALEHICARNHYGLTVDALRALDPSTLNVPNSQSEFRSRYQISEEDWRQIRELLTKLHKHQIDSPLSPPSPPASSSHHEGAVITELPTPPPDSSGE